MKSPRYVLSVLCFFIVSFASCVSTKSFVKHASYDTRFVPQGYDPSKHILLVAELTHPYKPGQIHAGLTSKLDKALKEYFPYRYQIVSIEDIESGTKYSDTSVYKYALLNNYNIIRRTTTTTTVRTDNTGTHTSSVSPSARSTYISFGFYDRPQKAASSSGTSESARIEWSVAAFSELVKKAMQERRK